MVYCAAYGCNNNSMQPKHNKAEKITFHIFPKNSERRKLWTIAVRRDKWTPTSKSVLCSKHFKESAIDRTSLSCVRLRDGAVPEIFPSHPPRPEKVIKEKKEKKPPKGVVTEPQIVKISSSTPSKRSLDMTDLEITKSVVELCNTQQALQETEEKLASSVQDICFLKKKIKVLHQHNRRLKKKVDDLKNVIVSLREEAVTLQTNSRLLDKISKTSICLMKQQEMTF